MKTVLYSLLLLLAFSLPGNAGGPAGPPPKDQAPPVIVMDVTHPSNPYPKTKSECWGEVSGHVIWALIAPGVGHSSPNYTVEFVNASYITNVSLQNLQTGACYQGIWPSPDMTRIYVPDLAGEWKLTITVMGGEFLNFTFVAI